LALKEGGHAGLPSIQLKISKASIAVEGQRSAASR